MRPTPTGLIARERQERFKLEAITELFLRAAGIWMIFAAFPVWLLLPTGATPGSSAMPIILISLLVGLGLGVYAFGTRGFRRQITLELNNKTLALTKINVHGQSRLRRTYDLERIESVFIKRPEAKVGLASLNLRVAQTLSPVIALTGELSELEALHQQLCAVIKLAENGSGAKPVPIERAQAIKKAA